MEDMKRLIVSFILFMPGYVFSQDSDTLRTRLLSEVVVSGAAVQNDTLQNFYQANPSSTTEQVLSRMRGMSLIRRGAFGQEPLVRGLGGGQINVTIDGMKMFGACTDKMDPVTIYVEPVNLKTAEVTSGVAGAEWGSTFGGAVNMKLSKPSFAKPGMTGRAALDYQSSARNVNYFSTVNIAARRGAYLVNAAWRKSNNYLSAGRVEIPYSQYEKANVSLSGRWGVGASDTLQADILADRGWNLGFPALIMDVRMATAGIVSLTWEKAGPFLFFRQMKAKAYHNQIHHSMDDAGRTATAMSMVMPGRSVTSGAYAEGEVHIFHQHRTFVKFEAFRNSLLGEMSMHSPGALPMYMQSLPLSIRSNEGIFIRQEYKLNNRNKFSFSVRTDYFADRVKEQKGRQQVEMLSPGATSGGSGFVNTFAVNYRSTLSALLMLEVNGGYGERAPMLGEKFGFYQYNRFDGFDYVGNPELSKETSFTVDAAVTVFPGWAEIEIAPFFRNIRNFISAGTLAELSAMTPGAAGVKKYLNEASGMMTGLDVVFVASPVRHVQLISTVKYTRGQVTGGRPMPLILPLKALTSLKYGITKRISVQGDVEFSAAQQRAAYWSGERKTPGYSIFSLQADVKLNNKVLISGGVQNITDRLYREHLDWSGIPRPGRNFFLNVSVRF